uniref:60S ribosomal protein L27 n=1 Tax=Anncaliia algerae TaxID=723287 RepID=E3PYC6_9MICR|nr:60S ribosomal protein L27 [Anncaliia algerae]
MLFSEKTFVVVLKGRYAGKKGLVLSSSTEKNRYLVVGIYKLPKPITEDMNEKTKAKRSKFGLFIKSYNGGHLLCTRYKSDLNINAADFENFKEPEQRKALIDKLRKIFEDGKKENKSKWLFTKLTV